MLDLIPNKILLIVAAVLLIVTNIFTYQLQSGKIAKYKLEHTEKAAAALIESHLSSVKLQEEVSDLRKQKDLKISAINTRLESNINGLLNRPSRDQQVPNSSGASNPTAATGKDLSREDGGFLIREAARADALVVELKECRDQYNRVKTIVNSPK